MKRLVLIAVVAAVLTCVVGVAAAEGDGIIPDNKVSVTYTF